MTLPLPTNDLSTVIFAIRGQRVIMASDLAGIYGTTTSRLNEQVKRNLERFPEDFMFQLTLEEAKAHQHSRSQNAILKRGLNIKYLPFAFTEHGALMAANVINSSAAVTMSVYVVRAFIQQREILATNQAILKRLADIDKTLLQHDGVLRDIYKKIMPLLQPPPEPIREKIGFHPKK